MNEKTVGTLKDNKDGNYASKFEIEVEYIDELGTVGNIIQKFNQEIVVPKQEFAYQGTYWKNGIGEGTFNVNPIVFNTAEDSWANNNGLTPDHTHEWLSSLSTSVIVQTYALCSIKAASTSMTTWQVTM